MKCFKRFSTFQRFKVSRFFMQIFINSFPLYCNKANDKKVYFQFKTLFSFFLFLSDEVNEKRILKSFMCWEKWRKVAREKRATSLADLVKNDWKIPEKLSTLFYVMKMIMPKHADDAAVSWREIDCLTMNAASEMS